MSSMTTTQTLRFNLPGKWARIDLTSEASSRASIRRLLDQVTNKRDDLAGVRAELRGRFQKAADLAREGGAVDMRIAQELAKGVPLPAWATLFEPTIEDEDFARLGITELKQVLDMGTRTSAPVGTKEMDSDKIVAIRQSWRRTSHVVEGEVERDFEIVEADYWLAAGNPNRVALLTFSTAYADYEEEMLALFDAVVGTIRWQSPDEAAEEESTPAE